MPRPAAQLARDMFSGANFRATIVLLTSAVCLAAWHVAGSFGFWMDHVTSDVLAAVMYFASGAVWLGLVPLLVVKLVLRERLADYGVQWGDLRFALVCCVLAAPLIVGIGYSSAQSPAFQAIYPLNPLRANPAPLWRGTSPASYSGWPRGNFISADSCKMASGNLSACRWELWCKRSPAPWPTSANRAPRCSARSLAACCGARWPGAPDRCWPAHSNTGSWARAWISSFADSHRTAAGSYVRRPPTAPACARAI